MYNHQYTRKRSMVSQSISPRDHTPETSPCIPVTLHLLQSGPLSPCPLPRSFCLLLSLPLPFNFFFASIGFLSSFCSWNSWVACNTGTNFKIIWSVIGRYLFSCYNVSSRAGVECHRVFFADKLGGVNLNKLERDNTYLNVEVLASMIDETCGPK